MYLSVVWALCDSDAVRGEGLLVSPLLIQGIAQMKVGTPCLRIERDDVTIERFFVPIDARLTPSQRPKHNQSYYRNTQSPLLP